VTYPIFPSLFLSFPVLKEDITAIDDVSLLFFLTAWEARGKATSRFRERRAGPLLLLFPSFSISARGGFAAKQPKSLFPLFFFSCGKGEPLPPSPLSPPFPGNARAGWITKQERLSGLAPINLSLLFPSPLSPSPKRPPPCANSPFPFFFSFFSPPRALEGE